MGKYDKPLHIVTAHVGELKLSLAQQTVDEKSNEIPAVRELIELLDIEGCMVVADAMHCQKETAKAVIAVPPNINDFINEDIFHQTRKTTQPY